MDNYFKGKKVLLLGGLGFVGKNVLIRLVKLGALPIIVYKSNHKDSEDDYLKKCTLLKTDPILDFESIIDSIRQSDIIINLILGDKNDPVFQHQNTELNLKILNLCISEKIDAVHVHLGSRLQYARKKGAVYDENDDISSSNVYGIEKSSSEQHFISFHKRYGLKVICMRISNIYGYHDPLSNTIVDRMIDSALKGQIQIDQDIERFKDFIYIDDFVDCLLECIKNKDCYGKVFNVGGERIKLIDLAKAVSKVFGKGKDVKILYKESEDFSFCLDISKIKKVTGWAPKTSLEKGLVMIKDKMGDSI